MMKLRKNTQILGFLAVLAIFGLVFVGCGDKGDSGDNSGGSSGGTGEKSSGVTVTVPTLASKTDTIITIHGVPTPENGQAVEYAINTSSTAPTSGWQDGLIFHGLTAETTYYIFARSKASDTHNAGTPSAGLQVTTDSPSIKLTVTNTDEWNVALTTIRTGGNGTTANSIDYTITVSGNVLVSGSTANSFSTVSNIAVTINGNGKLYIIGAGSLLTITNNQRVYIDSANLTLEGLKIGQNDSAQNNTRAVVYIAGGTLELLNGTICNNSNYGVSVNNGTLIGRFIMNGGTISGNTDGGVSVASGASFRMSNGIIYGTDDTDIPSGTALTNSGGTATYGADGTGTNIIAIGTTESRTIEVVNGVLVRPGFIVTFNRNGGNTDAIPSTKALVYPATNIGTLPTPPTRTGWTFKEWNTQANGSGTAFDATTTVIGPITVYAQWVSDYIVTFNKNYLGNTEVAQTKTVIYPATSVGTLPASPTRTVGIGEATFIGWNTQANGGGTAFDENTTITGNITVYAQWVINFSFNLGDTGPGGGKIFYRSDEIGFTMTDTNETCYYLEAAPADVSTSLAWASSGFILTNITGSIGVNIGTGRKNTAQILAIDANAPAAKACNDYTNNGKSDWFLPSASELRLLYENRNSVGNFGGTVYWSSSQSNNGSAGTQGFGGIGGQESYGKDSTYSVRAVRAF